VFRTLAIGRAFVYPLIGNYHETMSVTLNTPLIPAGTASAAPAWMCRHGLGERLDVGYISALDWSVGR
jgi:hypothetical protein